MSFAENLKRIPGIDGVERVILYDNSGREVGDVPNAKATAGSCAVYSYLASRSVGPIDRDLAEEGINLFAEYAKEARDDSDSHPNIQRLFRVRDGEYLELEVVRG